MKVKTFLILIIISLLVINILTLVRYYKLNQQKITDKANSIKQEINKNDELDTYKSNFKLNILHSKSRIDDVMIRDSLDNKLPIHEIFDNKQEKILVCRFSQWHCESCVNSSIRILRSWVDSIGIRNVVFLGNHRNNRIFNRTIPSYGIQDLKVYNCPTINIPVEKLGYPYYFILDSNLHISNVFVPDKATPNITNEYLETLCKKF